MSFCKLAAIALEMFQKHWQQWSTDHSSLTEARAYWIYSQGWEDGYLQGCKDQQMTADDNLGEDAT